MNQLPVAVIAENSPQRALFVAPDAELEEVLELLLADKTRKSVFLLDEEARLSGVVNMKELLIWGWLHLGLLNVPFTLSERKLRRLARAQVVADLQIPNSKSMVISVAQSVEDALDTLLLSNQDAVAVVDENGRVINDLHIDDLLTYALQEAKGANYA
ncbi:MAG: CBS domain-containing protein [Candidatus Promineifilaceae bacterium]|nr:CBS domain-containing protein [Anaerolineaceae bacterium]